MKQTKIIVLALVALVLLVGVIVGKKLLTVKPGEQKGEWQTYTDTVQKYQFNYPADWFLSEGNPNQLANYDMEKAPAGQFDPERDKDKIKIEIYTTNQPYELVEKYLEEQESGEKMFQGPAPSYELTMIDGQQAKRSVEETLGGILSIDVQNPVTGQVHSITAMPNYNLHKDIVDQIIATLKFTKQSGNLPATKETSFSETGVYYESGPSFGYPYVWGEKDQLENYVQLVFTNECISQLDEEEKPCSEVKFVNEMVLKISGQKVGEEVKVLKVEAPGD